MSPSSRRWEETQVDDSYYDEEFEAIIFVIARQDRECDAEVAA